MNLWQDIRYGERMLRKSPGFAATAVLTLALGIGATTAVFSVCDSLLWKPIALPHLESLVMVLQRIPENSNEWNSGSPADLDDIRRESTTLDNLATWGGGMANIVGAGGEPERVIQTLVSANFFTTLGVQPALGRGFQEGEDQPGREREVVLSDRLWRRRFAADPSVVGKNIRLDDQNFLVTGVMPASFDFPMATELWTPNALTPASRANRRNNQLEAAARLRPGHTLEQAGAELDRIAARLEKSYPDTNKGRRYMAWPARRYMVDSETQQYSIMLLCSVIFVLLIACVNVANLQFARATGRLREVAVRTALGASRWRVITQLVTESILLSVLGAVFGLLIGIWGMGVIRSGMPPEIQRYILGWKDIQLDARTMLFTLAAAVLSGILAGLAPAWQCSRPNLTDALKEGGRGGSTGGARQRLRNTLVASEVALAVILLVGAGLMVRGFRRLVEYGERMEPATLLTMRLALTDNKYHEPHQRIAYYRDVLDRIRVLPGVRVAVAVSALPYSDHSSGRIFTIEGRPMEPDQLPNGMYQVTTPAYFDMVHIPLVAGRLLAETDGADAPKVALISQRMAERWWKNESPVGKHIRLGAQDSKNPWLTIVGVVGDIMHNPYDREPRRTIYVPFPQAPQLSMDVGVRIAGDPLALAPAISAAIRGVDREQPITDLRTMERSIHNRAIGLNYMAVLMAVFGVLALCLSAIGVYGVMAYMVSEQTRDIGIRMALGAERQSVLAMVFRRGMLTIGAGLAVGLPLAFGFARLMASLIFGVSSNDPATFISIPLALLAAASLAIYIPARRATKIDPIVALRYEETLH
jgi:putative ABC transport system permease protein